MFLFFPPRNVVPVTECDKVDDNGKEWKTCRTSSAFNEAIPLPAPVLIFPTAPESSIVCTETASSGGSRRSGAAIGQGREEGEGFSPPSSPPDWQLLSSSPLLSSPPILEDRAMRRQ